MGHSFSLVTYLSLTPTHTVSAYLIGSMVAIKLLGVHASSLEIKEIKLGVDFGWVKKLKGRGCYKGGCGWHFCLTVGEARWLGLELEGRLDTLLSQTILQGTCTLTCRVSIKMR
jgi:hypothetical protein